MKFAIVLNFKKQETINLAQQLCEFLQARECELFIPKDKPGFAAHECENLHFDDCDMIIILGGDGTLLSACHYIKNKELALLSVNMGKMGFLTEIEKSELFSSMEQILSRTFQLEERRLLQAEIWRNGNCFYRDIALNDFVLNNGSSYRAMTITTEINGEFLSTVKSSGLIFSSPTGSTAYALSAGGPIIMPLTPALLIVHLAAHDLYTRPVVLPTDSCIRIRFTGDKLCRLIADGQFIQDCIMGDEIIFCSAPETLKLVKIKKAHFFTSLNNKMGKKL